MPRLPLQRCASEPLIECVDQPFNLALIIRLFTWRHRGRTFGRRWSLVSSKANMEPANEPELKKEKNKEEEEK